MSTVPRRQELLRIPSVTLNRWPWSVIHLQGLVEIKDLWGAWEKCGQPYWSFCWCSKPSSDRTTEREKSPRRIMVTSFYSPMLQDKCWKSLRSSGLKAVDVDGVDFKDDLSSLGTGNISDTGEFHIEDCCPRSSCLKSIQLTCPSLFSRASSLCYVLLEIATSMRGKILPWTACPKLRSLSIIVYWHLWEWQYPFITITYKEN